MHSNMISCQKKKKTPNDLHLIIKRYINTCTYSKNKDNYKGVTEKSSFLLVKQE